MDRNVRTLFTLVTLACLASGCFNVPAQPTPTPTATVEVTTAAMVQEAAPQEGVERSGTGPLIAIRAPLPGAFVPSAGFVVAGDVSAPGSLLRITLRDITNTVLQQVGAAVGSDGRFEALLSYPVAVTTTGSVTVEVLDAQTASPLSSARVEISLLPGGVAATPTTVIPAVVATSPPVVAADVSAASNVRLTTPRAGERVTFPVHIAGYLSTPQNAPVTLNAALRYSEQEVAASLTTIPWGRINVIIFNLDIPGGVGAHPDFSQAATLVISEAASGRALAEQPVILVGKQESKPVYPFFVNRATGGLQSVERRVWGFNGSNAALSELFWGLSNVEEQGGVLATYIPPPSAVRGHVDTGASSPLNGIVHVLDSRVVGGVGYLTLSPSIRAADANRPDLAAAQIRETMRYFPNVNDVAISAGGYLWQTTSGQPPPTVVAPPTEPAPLQPHVRITTPRANDFVASPLRVIGEATVPRPGEKLVLQLVAQGMVLLTSDDLNVMGAAVGQTGVFQDDLAFTPPPQDTPATLSVSYVNAAGTILAQDRFAITLRGAPGG